MATRKRRSTGTRKPAVTKSLKNFNTKTAVNDATKVGLFVAGLYGGRKVIALIDSKLNPANPEQATSGISGFVEGLLGPDIKAKLPALGITVLGVVSPQFIKNENFKAISYGVGAAGGLKSVEQFTGKNLLSGIDGMPSLGQFATANLPALSEAVNMLDIYDDNVQGMGKAEFEPEFSEELEIE